MTYHYRLLPDGTGYVDETGVHRGVPPTQEDFDRVVLMTMHRRLFTEGKIEYKVIDPWSPEPIPSVTIVEKEMTIEEAKRRYSDADIPETGTKP
jgi:hypothetical protein